MEAYLARVKDSWERVGNCALATQKDTSAAALSEFADALNLACPNDAVETELFNLVQVFGKHRKAFCFFVKRLGYPYLQLLIGGLSVVDMFDLRGTVFIKWDAERARYEVKPSHRTYDMKKLRVPRRPYSDETQPQVQIQMRPQQPLPQLPQQK